MNKEDIYKYFDLQKKLKTLCKKYIKTKHLISSTEYSFFEIREILYLNGGMLEIYYTLIGEKDSYKECVSIDTIAEG